MNIDLFIDKLAMCSPFKKDASLCELPKKSGKTSLIEGVNCILRQRISRLVRKTVAFSKIFTNHTGAIRYFLSHYNRWAYEKFFRRTRSGRLFYILTLIAPPYTAKLFILKMVSLLLLLIFSNPFK